MIALIIFGCLILVGLVVFQMSKINEMIKRIKGEEAALEQSNNNTGWALIAFMIVFLAGTIYSAYYYKNYMLGYGPLLPASEHAGFIDGLFNVTLWATGIVFVITHILLFYFAWKYKYKKGAKALYMPHDNKLEVIWTAAPAVVMAYLVINGLVVWNKVMADVVPNDNHIEIEATGMQFAWILRYPGLDGKLGTRDFKLTSATNDLGQDWNDPKNWDDFKPDEIVLPKGRKVRVRITSRDVLHSFYLPHHKVKMDAVPGLPTYFVFTPTMTTEEYKNNLRKYPEWNVPADPADPGGKKKWEAFTFELACAELCGDSHFAMRRAVKVVTPAQYDAWNKAQASYYMANVRGKEDDPLKGKVIPMDAKVKKDSTSPSTVPAKADTGKVEVKVQ